MLIDIWNWIKKLFGVEDAPDSNVEWLKSKIKKKEDKIKKLEEKKENVDEDKFVDDNIDYFKRK